MRFDKFTVTSHQCAARNCPHSVSCFLHCHQPPPLVSVSLLGGGNTAHTLKAPPQREKIRFTAVTLPFKLQAAVNPRQNIPPPPKPSATHKQRQTRGPLSPTHTLGGQRVRSPAISNFRVQAVPPGRDSAPPMKQRTPQLKLAATDPAI